MASETEASCDADPNFAVICSFLEKFGNACGLQAVDFVDLQQMLENTTEVSPVLIDLHIKLMRKIRKGIYPERWERGIVRFCHMYSNQDAWEIERFGYKKARLSAKIRLLKELLEMQFDNNISFKNKINGITSKELRSHPIGKDKLGNAYWYQIDDSCQIRVYKEDPDEETWALVAKDRAGLVNLISKLSDNHDSSSTDAVTNEDSNSNNEETKTVLDTGQQDSNSSKKSSDDDKPPELKQEIDDENTTMDSKEINLKMPELAAPHEEKKPELSGVKEKYIRSDNFIQSNRKAVESAGFVDIGIGARLGTADMKRPLDEDLEDPSLLKRPRTARPTLLGNKKKPYQQEEDEEDEMAEEEELEEEENVDEEEEEDEEDGDDEESEVGEEIEEPLMLVTGKGCGRDNKCGSSIVGEVIEDEVMFVYGEGSGQDCETGNEDKKEGNTSGKNSTDDTDNSIISPTRNNFKLGTIIDSKTDNVREKYPPKKAPSRWDMGKPDATNSKSVTLESGGEGTIGNEDKSNSALKNPMFFFGPGSGFSFKTPTTVAKSSASMKFGATSAPKAKQNLELTKCTSDLKSVNISEAFSNQNDAKDAQSMGAAKHNDADCKEYKDEAKPVCEINTDVEKIDCKVVENVDKSDCNLSEDADESDSNLNKDAESAIEEGTINIASDLKQEKVKPSEFKTNQDENVFPDAQFNVDTVVSNKDDLKSDTLPDSQTEVTKVDADIVVEKAPDDSVTKVIKFKHDTKENETKPILPITQDTPKHEAQSEHRTKIQDPATMPVKSIKEYIKENELQIETNTSEITTLTEDKSMEVLSSDIKVMDKEHQPESITPIISVTTKEHITVEKVDSEEVPIENMTEESFLQFEEKEKFNENKSGETSVQQTQINIDVKQTETEAEEPLLPEITVTDVKDNIKEVETKQNDAQPNKLEDTKMKDNIEAQSAQTSLEAAPKYNEQNNSIAVDIVGMQSLGKSTSIVEHQEDLPSFKAFDISCKTKVCEISSPLKEDKNTSVTKDLDTDEFPENCSKVDVVNVNEDKPVIVSHATDASQHEPSTTFNESKKGFTTDNVVEVTNQPEKDSLADNASKDGSIQTDEDKQSLLVDKCENKSVREVVDKAYSDQQVEITEDAKESEIASLVLSTDSPKKEDVKSNESNMLIDSAKVSKEHENESVESAIVQQTENTNSNFVILPLNENDSLRLEQDKKIASPIVVEEPEPKSQLESETTSKNQTEHAILDKTSRNQTKQTTFLDVTSKKQAEDISEENQFMSIKEHIKHQELSHTTAEPAVDCISTTTVTSDLNQADTKIVDTSDNNIPTPETQETIESDLTLSAANITSNLNEPDLETVDTAVDNITTPEIPETIKSDVSKFPAHVEDPSVRIKADETEVTPMSDSHLKTSTMVSEVAIPLPAEIVLIEQSTLPTQGALTECAVPSLEMLSHTNIKIDKVSNKVEDNHDNIKLSKDTGPSFKTIDVKVKSDVACNLTVISEYPNTTEELSQIIEDKQKHSEDNLKLASKSDLIVQMEQGSFTNEVKTATTNELQVYAASSVYDGKAAPESEASNYARSEKIIEKGEHFQEQSIPSNLIDVNTPLYSISKLIKKVPLNVHDKTPKKRLKPAKDICTELDLPVRKLAAMQELSKVDVVIAKKHMQASHEGLLDLSNKVMPRPEAIEAKTAVDMIKLPPREEAIDLSKPDERKAKLQKFQDPPSKEFHYVPEVTIPQTSSESMSLPTAPVKSCNDSNIKEHEVIQVVDMPASSQTYEKFADDPIEQIDEINVAKSFLIDNETVQKEPEYPIDPLEEPVIIQEIGSISNIEYKKSKLEKEIFHSIIDLDKQVFPANEEEDIVKIRQATNAPSTLEVQVQNPLLQPSEGLEYVELQCVKHKVPLLTEEPHNVIDLLSDDDFDYDEGNISEPMELEEIEDSEIIQHPEAESKQTKEVVPSESEEESVIPDEKPRVVTRGRKKVLEQQKAEEPKKEPKKDSKKEPKKTLQSLSMDFTGEAPDLSQVQAMVSRSRKRGAKEEPKEEEQEAETGGKRRKMRGKRTVDKGLRRSIEEAKNKEVSSSDEEQKKEEQTPSAKPEKKPKAKRKRSLLGLDIPEGGVVELPLVRQSRRIAQIKIKEEAERRKLEEIALDEMKHSQKLKSKKQDDKDFKAEKRKHNKIITDDDTTTEEEINDTVKKGQKRKHGKFDGIWRSSSDSSSEDSHVEEEEEEEEESYIETIKSDHEFSPESDLENAADPQPLKRARTVRKEDEEAEEDIDDTNCQKCNKSDHPEWILLCDGCDAGWHCSCLRPALLVIPEGDWYCPPCQHNSLVKMLQDKLVELDKIQSKREIELRRKERLAYVGISLANVLPEKTEDSQKSKKERIRVARVRISGDEETDSQSDSDSRSSNSGSSSSSSSSSSNSDEPIYKLRQRRQAHSYQFKDYDDLIKSAIQDDVEVKQQNEPVSKGKDMATIVQAEAEDKKDNEDKKEEDYSDDDVIKPVKRKFAKNKHRKFNNLDFTSEEDADSDEDFKGSSSDEEDEDDEDEFSSSNSSIIGRKKGRGSIRRSTRARISRFDREFINDDSEDSDEPRRGKRNRSDWEETDASEEESDGSWGRKKKRSSGSAHKPVSSSTIKRKKSKKKSNDDSEAEVYKRKKPKIKFGGLDDDDGGKRRTRGKKINYLDALGTDSEEEGRRRNQVKDEESEDEFVLNEEEDDVQDDEGREDGSSDDSNIGGLVPAVKKGSKKGIGKGGIKRIKRYQGEEEEALFPPLPDAPKLEPFSSSEMETNPIEQINKNLEAMDEKDLDMMMEDQDFANKQLQMVAAQLEKEKRRKEMEARKLEMLPQPAPVPLVQKVIPSSIPTVIQAMPVSMSPQVPPQHMHPMRQAEQLQPIHHDLPPHPIHHQLASLHRQSPQQLPHQSPQQLLPHSPQHMLSQSPQHMLHQGPHPQMMVLDTGTPKKRGRKPKTQLTSPELTPVQSFTPTTPSLGDKSDDSADFAVSFNADGTPKKRRGRGKGKKTLEKEAAAAALAASQSPPSGPAGPSPVKVIETTEPEVEPVPAEVKTTTPPELPMVGGKLGVASAPQPFSQSQPKPSVITRMLQTQPGQPAYPVGGVTRNFGTERPTGPRLQLGPVPPFMPGGPGPGAIPPRGLHPGAFRSAANHYPVIRSGAPPMRPQNMPPHIFHHPMESQPPGGPPMPERSSPVVTSPPSSSPLNIKSEQTPPPPYVVRPAMVRFPSAAAAPAGMPPRHPQMLPQMHSTRPPYPSAPPHNYHYAPPYSEGSGQFQAVPPQYQEQQFAGDPDGPKNYEEEENGEFGGLVSYFSSQREDDLDT